MNKHRMKKTAVLLLFCCCFATDFEAQQVLKLPEVDAIGYDVGGVGLYAYTRIGNDLYIKRNVDIGSDDAGVDKGSYMRRIKWNVSESADTVTGTEIRAAQKGVIDALDLRPAALSDYVGHTFDINDNNTWRRIHEHSSLVLKFLSRNIVAVQELYHGCKEGYADYRTSMTIIPDSVVMWRVANSHYLLPTIIEMKGGKRMFVFRANGRSYMLIPTEKGDRLARFGWIRMPAYLTLAGRKYDDTAPDDFCFFQMKEFYGVHRTAGKCRLIDAFDNNVLGKDYDTITYDRGFFIAKVGQAVDVFNLYLKKLDMGTVKEAREITRCVIGCIEVLNETGPAYYDELGKRVLNPIKQPLYVCGTVPHWTFTILKKHGKYLLQKYTGGPGVREDEEEYFALSGCLPTDSIAFTDGRKETSYDGNSSFLHDINVSPQWIKVGRNGKFGIIGYQYDQPNNARPKTVVRRDHGWERQKRVYPIVNITGETLLPIDNDSIYFGSDGLTYFFKHGKIGLFPRHKEPRYTVIKRQTGSFYHIIKDGKEGWLDIKTNREYF